MKIKEYKTMKNISTKNKENPSVRCTLKVTENKMKPNSGLKTEYSNARGLGWGWLKTDLTFLAMAWVFRSKNGLA